VVAEGSNLGKGASPLVAGFEIFVAFWAILAGAFEDKVFGALASSLASR
jgi:hypothetical protein